MWSFSLLLSVLVLGLYHYATQCEFVFDDVSAIVKNPDVSSNVNPTSSLIWNDFWGTPMAQEQSHKSYRPLTVLSFKLNYLLFGENPFSFHVVNVVLYIAVCLLFHQFCSQISGEITIRSRMVKHKDDSAAASSEQPSIACLATLLFAVHPIHVEAVVGVVGRAELLSAIFYLLSIIFYMKLTFLSKMLSMVFILCSVASKEQGITAIAVCLFVELVIIRQERLFLFLKTHSGRDLFDKTIIPVLAYGGPLIILTVLILSWRFYVMQGSLPHFTVFDNPASYSPTPTRQLTYNYLLSINSWLLLSPCQLLCDWTMGVVPLIHGFTDPRNFFTIFFWTVVLLLTITTYIRQSTITNRVISIALLIVYTSYLPASNLFFSVGFVVADRILFLPSMGFSLLMAAGFSKLYRKLSGYKLKYLLKLMFGLIVISHSLQTIHRSYDWKNDRSLFQSALKVTEENAKVWNNIGHTYEKEGNWQMALNYFIQASNKQPDDIGSFINIGTAWERLQKYDEAEKSFRKAKSLFPKPIKGKSYKARLAPKHLDIFIKLGNLIKRNENRLNEVDKLYQEAISMSRNFIDAYINRGEVLSLMGRLEDAIEIYQKALDLPEAPKSDLYFNIGVIYNRMKNQTGAYEAYTWAIYHNKYHIKALVNSASILLDTRDTEHMARAELRLNRVLETDGNNLQARSLLGSVYLATNRSTEALSSWHQVLEILPSHRTALYNVAYYYYKSEDGKEKCLESLKQLFHFHPDFEKGRLLQGDVLLNKYANPKEAKRVYEKIVEKNEKEIEARHNLCVCLFQLEELYEAENCFLDLALVVPNESYITGNLLVVRKEIEKRIKLGTLKEEKKAILDEVKDQNIVFKNSPRVTRDDEEILYEASQEEDQSDDGDDEVRLLERAERIHQNFLDVVNNNDPNLIDVKLQQAVSAVKDLTAIKTHLSWKRGGDDEECDGDDNVVDEQNNNENSHDHDDDGQLKKKLLQLLDELESKL